MNKERFFGGHLSIAGGVENIFKSANILNINACQIHPTPPQRWSLNPYVQKPLNIDFNLFFLKKIFLHSIYLINLASPNIEFQQKSCKSLLNDLIYGESLALATNNRVDVEGVIFHVGSFKDEPDESLGIKRIAQLITDILEEYHQLSSSKKIKLLLEVSAGSGKVVGSKLETLNEIFSLIDAKFHKNLGFVLDTQHMWASGYDLKDSLDVVLENIEKSIGFENICAIHLNDSKTKLASTVDRHENLGQGEIGLEALMKFVNFEKFKNATILLETPNMKDTTCGKIDIELLRENLM